jgi:effector-binding domain-containing protein
MKASKRKLVILIVLLVVLAVILASCSLLNVEKQKYTVIEKDRAFQIRTYQPYIAIETLVDSDFEEAGNTAFRRLFNYINGNNLSKEKIAMTTPVNQQLKQTKGQKIAMTAPVNQQKSGDSWAVSFVMPSKYTMQTIPQPIDQNVVLKQVPSRKMASIKYSGSWTRQLYDKKELALRQFIEKQNLKIIGQPTWARYNPPFYPSFLKRNEILFPVE